MKKPPLRAAACYFGTKCPKALYKSVRVVEVVIVENVLVLVCDRLVRHGHFVHLTFLVHARPPVAVNEPVEVKGVFHFIGLRRKAIIGMLFQIVFLGIERRQPSELQNAPISGHGGKLAWGHQLPSEPLGVLAVTFGLSTGASLGLHGDGGLAQPVLGNFLNGAGLTATEEQNAVHVAENGFRIFVVDSFALGKLLIQQAQADLTGADDRHQLFQVWHLSGVGRLVPQHPHMMGQSAAVNNVRPFAQEVEHLRKGQRHKKIVGAVGVADTEKGRRPAIPHAVKLQLVIGHDLPELGDVKGSKASAAGDQNAFGRLARDKLSRTF